MPTHNIVVLGGSFAGLGVAHNLLRHVIPHLPNSDDYKLILVNPSDHFYFKPASPRMTSREDLISFDTLMIPISRGFSDYHQFELVQAYARQINPETRDITLELANADKTSSTIHYDTLVIATGASSTSALWSPATPKEATEAALTEFREKLKTAQRVIIAGGGAVGVETAGELGFDHGKQKDIVLYSGTTRLLSRLRADVGKRAEEYLNETDVTVVHNTKILSNGPGADGNEVLHLSDGSKITADLFIDARGTKLNNSYLPPSWLNERGAVAVDDTQRVKAAGSGARIYAVGDIASYSSGGIMDIQSAIQPLAAVIEHDLTGGESKAQPTYTGQKSQSMLVPVGRKRAVGVIFDYWLPSYIGHMIKGKTFFADQGVATVMGDKWTKKKIY
ncbi:apoptosis-inducing factor 1 [Diplodia corticola]|uniref:Apoptosis-inducing factor 1 n=1 Tax=Diplodia corticola TaxID=236234 RepID=A0A1J9RBD8_9PEZI|nr:apoptosis-inducing factor 1 [Diplodia corticola]OJD29747.1 apoptosis-inducing factor 1 [Diplodia corticola]